ncbi:MAG: S8 family serine peptidase, partial [Thermoanaerobaculia bacterium]|nr:S8 family serine peptidase [Thermoanaerobaculia bacterium]
MRRALIAVSILAMSLTASAGEELQSWLVATTVPSRIALEAHVEASKAGKVSFIDRSVSTFRYVRGYAVSLTETEAKELERLPTVRWVEPNHERILLQTAPRPSVPRSAQASSSQRLPVGVAMIGAPEVWERSRGETIRIGVIDTGVDTGHPDLGERYAGGYDFFNRDEDPQDDNGHGTHVAGTIAALDNDFGVVGVAPRAEIYGLKVLDATGSGSVGDLIEAVEWAIDNDLDVINLSLGSEERSFLEEEAFELAEEAGVIAVAASGNAYMGIDRIDYPANYESVIAVGAIDPFETVASFSQRGTGLDFVALGVGVDSTIFNSYYGITTSSGAVLRAERMEYSPGGSFTGELVDCGLGGAGECPPEVEGEIALIKRGELTFADKSKNAKASGAKAVVIYNHHPDHDPDGGVIRGTLGTRDSWILTVGTSRTSGELLLSLTDRRVTLGEVTASDYARLNGTSMATPHVSGAIAILKAL